jgi:hypothetical protein
MTPVGSPAPAATVASGVDDTRAWQKFAGSLAG